MNTLIRKSAMMVALAVSLGLAGCATTANNDGLADRLNALEAKLVQVESMANNASYTANVALDAVDKVEACCDANTERMNRMFEKASSK